LIVKRVVIIKASLLPISETFIRDQLSALSSCEPIMVGVWEAEEALATTGIKREVVRIDDRSTEWRFLLARPLLPVVDMFRKLGVILVHAHVGPNALRVWPSVRAARLPRGGKA
jgi:hypothetical protein